MCNTLFDEPYLSTDPRAPGTDPALGLSSAEWLELEAGRVSMWGDYHAREVGLYLLRMAGDGPYLKFFL